MKKVMERWFWKGQLELFLSNLKVRRINRIRGQRVFDILCAAFLPMDWFKR